MNSPEIVCNILYVHFSGKRVISFHQSLQKFIRPHLEVQNQWLPLWVAPFLGQHLEAYTLAFGNCCHAFLGSTLSEPPFSFCSLSPHPLGVPGAHLWPSPRLQAPFPASYQPGGGLLPTHVHCAPGNTVSASSGTGLEGREQERGESLGWWGKGSEGHL